MNAKEYLSQAYDQSQRIQRKRNQLETLHELSTSTTSRISDMPRSGSPDPQRLEGVLAKIADLECEIAADEKRMVDCKSAVADLIAQVQDTQQMKILMSRYIDFLDWGEIASKLAIGRSWALKQHRQAIEYLEKILQST